MTREPVRRYEFGDFHLDAAERRLVRAGHSVSLTPKMFDLLRVLVENAGHLVDKERLLREVWPDAFVEEGNLNRGISVLRKTLGETRNRRYIETVPKCGYRFIAAVRTCESDEAGPAEHSLRSSTAPPATGTPGRAGIQPVVLAVGALLTSAVVVSLVLDRGEPSAAVRSASAPFHRQLTFTGLELTPSLSRDGTRVAFVSKGSPHRQVKVQEVAGGQPVVVFSAPEAGWLRWSPNDSELLFWARGGGLDGLYLAAVPGGTPRRISDTGLSVACWSPDGTTIALASFVDQKIRFLDKTGRQQRSISLQGTQGWIWDLDWSPVHQRLLVVADDTDRHAAVWSIDPDGSDQKKLVTAASEILAARWAPRGDAVYYFTRVNQTVSLFKVAIDPRHGEARDPMLLLSGLETDEGFGLSADGARLVYARAPYYSNLWIAGVGSDAARIERTQLTHGTSVIERPRVSPDGTTILFTMGYESRTNLYTIPVTGGIPRQLTFLDALSVGGVWSPDGRSIAFVSNEGGKVRIWVVNADGSSPRPVAEGKVSESYEMAWAPGDRLLYQEDGNRNYVVVDPRTWQQRPLIKNSTVGWVAAPAYSPDGSRIAVSWNRQPDRGLWTIDATERRETLVRAFTGPGDPWPWPIGWSPDGAFVYGFDGKRAAYRGVLVPMELTMTDVRILRIRISGGSTETIMKLPFEEVGSVAALPDGRRFVCTVYSSRSDVWIVEHFDGTGGTVTSADGNRQ